mmetsp:Transcript_8576/g.24203  ORF Transcript_8576/g.24203 Transcript_8576/m.24203 type:complete len:627 (-) Transcript_8576:166-2046(-)|eukprot:CAMPEP_0119131034 /NCGR_PEP_ID=MMETSP1310-20130426/9271_1 /TAXON_ID=464262 /ORGANISM="Genus nov. species nov., Strain RCC2339" /LENGTH=626 /DNA_ID=CAMNT_0007121583 /DNA_START=94 /DNA_END=1974 /DNA_ORIENTATION=-
MKGSMGVTGVVVVAAVLCGAVLGFDTGHHQDATWNVMAQRGYNAQSQLAVSLQNFYTDMYSQSPFQLLGLESTASDLHFDSLPTRARVQAYWDNFVVNTQNTIETVLFSNQISDNDRPLYYLSTLGITLHAVQDFYTHSNWAQLHPRGSCGCYRTDTWFTSTTDLTDLYTGLYEDATSCPSDNPNQPRHGAYCQGENKDSYIRPLWREAYIFSYVATAEWINAVETWVTEADAGGAALITAAKSYEYSDEDDSNNDDIYSDQRFAVQISEWVKADTGTALSADGHWKGWNTGDASAIGDTVQSLLRSSSVFRDIFLDANFHLNFDDNLYCESSPVNVPTVPSLGVQPFSNSRVIMVRIPYYDTDISNSFQDTPDIYSVVTVDGQVYREAAIQNEHTYTPMWTILHVLDTSTHVGNTVDITVRFYEIDVVSDDDNLNINGDNEVVTLQYNFINDDVTGDSTDRSPSFQGSGSRHVDFTMVFDSFTLAGCNPSPSVAQCDVEILGRADFCQRAAAYVDLCVESTTCSPNVVENEIAEAVTMNTLDVEASSSCQSCEEGGITGTFYRVTLLAPTTNDALLNCDTLEDEISDNGNTLGGVTVIYSKCSSAERMVLSALSLVVALFAFLFL